MLKTVPGIGYQLIAQGAPATTHSAGTKQ
jgi:hypothetical protein